ncbi:hypothetical protein C8J56DRAFT_894312 [Mycena floridula]|nr:hypothetical protein C8J56DRAFT_894312 [Mycena floridula]
MEWSERECPSALLEKCEPLSKEDAVLCLKHGSMRAFLLTRFVLWTRNFELCGLQRGDITQDCIGAAPLCAKYDEVHLQNRKGWQRKVGEWDGPLESNHYQIYDQDPNKIDSKTHLRRWMGFLEFYQQEELNDDNFIFPYFSANGTVDVQCQMSHDMVQGLLNEFAEGAKVVKPYTTHSLRRGGAQHSNYMLRLFSAIDSTGPSQFHYLNPATCPTDEHCDDKCCFPGIFIPDIASGPGAWKDAVKQWNEGDPARSIRPLKD